MTNKAKKQINEVIDLSPPKEWLYKCDCPKCISGMHFDKEIADSYRKRGELTNEVARLREVCEWAADMMDGISPARGQEIRDALARLAPSPEEPVTECPDCGVTLATAEQINKRCSPCMLERKFEKDGITMDEWYGGFAKIESTQSVPQKTPVCPNCKSDKQVWRDKDWRNEYICHRYGCGKLIIQPKKEPVRLESTSKFTHGGNTDAKFKQLHEVASIIVEYIEDPDRRKHYRSEIQQLTPTTEEPLSKDILNAFKEVVKATIVSEDNEVSEWMKEPHVHGCVNPKEIVNEWRELGPDEVICEGDECQGWDRDGWTEVSKPYPEYVGGSRSAHPEWMFRTRRPLPKREAKPTDNEVARLKLTPFTAHRLADRYREQLNQLTR